MSQNSYPFNFCFTSYGVKVRISSNSFEAFEIAVDNARSALLGNVQEIEYTEQSQSLELSVDTNANVSVIQNSQTMSTGEIRSFAFWKYFDSLVRFLVADHAPNLVFLHAGVVGWHGKAIILPGDSFFGKTTFVAELSKCGAEYYSDDFAIVDKAGLVHPFPRPLTIRAGSGKSARDTPTKIEDLGGTKGELPIPVGCVFFTKFEPEAELNYEFLTLGEGIVKIIGQTVAIRRNTEFAIKVLKNAFASAIIVKSPRTEAESFAREFLEFVDNTAI